MSARLWDIAEFPFSSQIELSTWLERASGDAEVFDWSRATRGNQYTPPILTTPLEIHETSARLPGSGFGISLDYYLVGKVSIYAWVVGAVRIGSNSPAQIDNAHRNHELDWAIQPAYEHIHNSSCMCGAWKYTIFGIRDLRILERGKFIKWI